MTFPEVESFWIRKQRREFSTCVSARNKRAHLHYIKNGFIPEAFQRDHFIGEWMKSSWGSSFGERGKDNDRAARVGRERHL